MRLENPENEIVDKPNTFIHIWYNESGIRNITLKVIGTRLHT